MQSLFLKVLKTMFKVQILCWFFGESSIVLSNAPLEKNLMSKILSKTDGLPFPLNIYTKIGHSWLSKTMSV